MIVIATVATILIIRRNRELRGIYNLRKELKIVKQYNKKPKSQPQEGALIGYAGKRAIYISDDAKHVFICGTTGSGKTVAISNFIKRTIEKDYPALIIDGKGDTGQGSILDIINTMNSKNGNKKKVYVINMSEPENSDIYNPFKGTTPTVAKDMIINMTDWSEEHYKLNAERYIQRVLQMLEIGGYEFYFERIVKAMKIDNFMELSRILFEKELITKHEHADNIELANTSGKISQSSIARFGTIAESEIGKIFAKDGVDILQALQEKAIILFILNPLTYPELSQAFGRLLLIDAKKAVGKLFKTPQKTFFIMDEISVYASPALTDLVNKSRSAGVTCILATQSLSDLDYACGADYKEQIIENCNNYIIMRQNSGVNAEKWANILGTRATLDVTYQLQQRGLETSETGFGSARRVREFLYHPDDIKSLQTGKGFYLSRDTNFNTKLDINKDF